VKRGGGEHSKKHLQQPTTCDLRHHYHFTIHVLQHNHNHHQYTGKNNDNDTTTLTLLHFRTLQQRYNDDEEVATERQ